MIRLLHRHVREYRGPEWLAARSMFERTYRPVGEPDFAANTVEDTAAPGDPLMASCHVYHRGSIVRITDSPIVMPV